MKVNMLDYHLTVNFNDGVIDGPVILKFVHGNSDGVLECNFTRGKLNGPFKCETSYRKITGQYFYDYPVGKWTEVKRNYHKKEINHDFNPETKLYTIDWIEEKFDTGEVSRGHGENCTIDLSRYRFVTMEQEFEELLSALSSMSLRDSKEYRYNSVNREREILSEFENNGEEIYSIVDTQAEFPGGQSALTKWLDANLIYPEAATKERIQGRVTVRFIIEKDGSIRFATIKEGKNPLLYAEAIRLVKSMPKWYPAYMGVSLVRSYFTLPISFRLPVSVAE